MSKKTVNITLESTIFQRVTQFLAESTQLNNPNVPKKSSKPELEIIDFFQPLMPPGEYDIKVKQVLYKKSNNELLDTFKGVKKILVKPPLNPLSNLDIYHHYPPKSSFGDFTEILPHLVLNQKSLPWEDLHFSQEKKIPCLALVMLDENESDVKNTPGAKVKIEKNLIPSKEDLKYLAHIIKPANGKEKAVLIANRLPTPEKNNVVHLIAVNEESKDDIYTSLYSWNFVCEAAKNSFQTILEKLTSGLFHLPEAALPEGNPDKETKKKIKATNDCLQQGFVPLPHFARNGQQIISWYRSPLTPFDVDMSFDIRYINNSSQLLRFFKKTRRLDTTYAAAWELGKWLTMEQKEIAVTLYNWKRQFAVKEKQKVRAKKLERNRAGKTLNKIELAISEVIKNEPGEQGDIPPSVQDWLVELVKLRAIPFSYLVPEQQLLPEESIRFFHVDEGWIWALIDGALSIGRQPTSATNKPIQVQELYLMGCIVRSEAIAHFPDLAITADGSILPVEQRLIGRDVLLCIFRSEQPLKTIELFLKPEGTHFGVDQKYLEKQSNENGAKETLAPEFIKKFFALPNEKIDDQKIKIPFRIPDKRVLNIVELSKKMKTTPENRSSTFALRMMEAAPKVIFKCT